MILNLISSEAVIAKVIADLDITEDNIRVSDMQEWIGEALSKIGGVYEMGPKVIVLPIKGYQCRIPTGFKTIGQVMYSKHPEKGWSSTRMSAGSFHSETPELECGTNHEIVTEAEYIRVYRQMNASRGLTYQEAVEELEKDIAMKNSVIHLTLANKDNFQYGSTSGNIGIQYSVKPGHIVFNVKDGYAKISGSSIPRDDFGYPMVPDNDSYIEAIYWYIVTKLLYPRLLKGNLPMNAFEHAEANFHIYSNRAYGEIKTPNADQLQSMNAVWTRTFPFTGDHDNAYANLSATQYIPNRF